jgi:hypothetical protein
MAPNATGLTPQERRLAPRLEGWSFAHPGISFEALCLQQRPPQDEAGGHGFHR